MKRFKRTPDKEVFDKWKRLVNMTPSALRYFMNSEEGKEAGLSKEEAREKGIKSGRESAEWILKMKPLARSFKMAEQEWTPDMWEWARRQNAFISRMSGNMGAYYYENGEMTRLLKALLIWGHDPEK